MKFLDKIALNRLISIISSFILSVIKIIKGNSKQTIDITPKPPIKKIPILKRRKTKQ